MNKKEILRKKISERKELSEDLSINYSNKIKKKLFNLSEFKDSTTTLFYVSIGKEVKTEHMINETIKTKTIVVPYIEDKIIKLSKIKSLDELEPGTFNIPEPKREYIRPVSIYDIDLVIIPGIAFDRKGNRIGYGKGHYDMLLYGVNIIKIGLAYDFQIIDNIPREAHDITLDKIITEKEVIIVN